MSARRNCPEIAGSVPSGLRPQFERVSFAVGQCGLTAQIPGCRNRIFSNQQAIRRGVAQRHGEQREVRQVTQVDWEPGRRK